MGCFLGCFGGSKDRKRRKQRNKVIPREHHRHPAQNSLQAQSTLYNSTQEGIQESPQINSFSELREKPEEQLSSNGRKKVTFDSNVTTYEHVSVFESVGSLPEGKEVSDQKGEEKIPVPPRNSQIAFEDDSITSSVGSCPPNYRYQNCRDSDDEAEERCDSYLEDDDYDDEEDSGTYDDADGDDVDERIIGHEVWCESVLTDSMESRTANLADGVILEAVGSPMDIPFPPNQELQTKGPNRHSRYRNDYVHSVLYPVENLTQWKTVKSKGTLMSKTQKETFMPELEAPPSFNSEPTFKQSLLPGSEPKSEQKKILIQELAVDASLSTWLTSSESGPSKTNLVSSPDTLTSKKVSSMSQGSHPARSFEDRPILGALTVEELKQLSAASSPRRSPSRSPDEMPIIGTVGTYWNDSVSSSKDSRSASSSSYKGIPNTTSKYREDKRVNWHATPFGTRLERALNNRGGTGEA